MGALPAPGSKRALHHPPHFILSLSLSFVFFLSSFLFSFFFVIYSVIRDILQKQSKANC